MPGEPAVLGEANKPIRVFSFSGGAYDTVMQMGVTHALLVSGLEAPHAVVGVSAGSVTAVALAEILQAGGGGPKVAPTQISKFREVVNAYVSLPHEMATALVPDIYQVDAERPLRAVPLPLQDKDEQEDRDEAILAKAGLIDIANDLLGLRVSVRTLTLIVRTLLGWNAARAAGGVKSGLGFVKAAFRLWAIFGASMFQFAPLAARVLAAVAQGIPRGLGFRNVAWFKQGLTAGELIYAGGRLRRKALRTAWIVIAALFCVYIWAAPLLVMAALASSLVTTAFVPAAVALAAGVLGLMTVAASVAWSRELLHLLFAHYDVADGLFDPHFLRSLFVRLFDPEYYGQIDLAQVVRQELRDERPSGRRRDPAALRQYSNGTRMPAIEVGVAAARVEDGRIELLRPETAVVKALMTAVAIPPLFEAQQLKERPSRSDPWYVDGSLVSNEPIAALLDRVRNTEGAYSGVNSLATAVHIYAVSSLPLGRELAGSGRRYEDLVDVGLRSLQLEALRDQTLTRRMTHLYSRALDQNGGAVQEIPAGSGKKFVKAWVFPVEPDQPIELNRRLPLAQGEKERRDLILEAVADGCRATLEALNPARLRLLGSGSVPCRALVAALKKADDMPGSASRSGPGVVEVCDHCSLNRGTEDAQPQRLRVPSEVREVVDWPRSGESSPSTDRTPKPAPLVVPSYEVKLAEDLSAFKEWVKAGDRRWADETRPTTSLLFAGGVFRGVYLVGVLNALSELGVKPDIVAGSSVGTITAAMAATVLRNGGAQQLPARRNSIVDLAGTFLAIDRLILTDRFADFVRGFTLRAASTDFSLRQLDHTFRTFDRSGSEDFGPEARLVLAGLERLFYLSPFDALELTRELRQDETGKALRRLRGCVQDWLRRSGVSQQFLGSEPLRTLIEHHVIRPLKGKITNARDLPLSTFLNDGILFLATATNLSTGSLEYVGLNPRQGHPREAMLIEALLASSAFPAVFRPRHAWEVTPRSGSDERYVDGGVMDNLPVDAVALVLNHLSSNGVIARTPSAPHLMFTASLEALSAKKSASEVAASWLEVCRRSREFRYNAKLEAYARLQQDLREVRDHLGAKATYDPVSIEVVRVIPQWLCGTFEFHPMLGFKRERQAASMAHGCATTLAAFSRVQTANPQWLEAWGIDVQRLTPNTFPESSHKDALLVPQRPKTKGNCWFRGHEPCPFYKGNNRSSLNGEVSMVYDQCGNARTHTPAGRNI